MNNNIIKSFYENMLANVYVKTLATLKVEETELYNSYGLNTLEDNEGYPDKATIKSTLNVQVHTTEDGLHVHLKDFAFNFFDVMIDVSHDVEPTLALFMRALKINSLEFLLGGNREGYVISKAMLDKTTIISENLKEANQIPSFKKLVGNRQSMIARNKTRNISAAQSNYIKALNILLDDEDYKHIFNKKGAKVHMFSRETFDQIKSAIISTDDEQLAVTETARTFILNSGSVIVKDEDDKFTEYSYGRKDGKEVINELVHTNKERAIRTIALDLSYESELAMLAKLLEDKEVNYAAEFPQNIMEAISKMDTFEFNSLQMQFGLMNEDSKEDNINLLTKIDYIQYHAQDIMNLVNELSEEEVKELVGPSISKYWYDVKDLTDEETKYAFSIILTKVISAIPNNFNRNY